MGDNESCECNISYCFINWLFPSSTSVFDRSWWQCGNSSITPSSDSEEVLIFAFTFIPFRWVSIPPDSPTLHNQTVEEEEKNGAHETLTKLYCCDDRLFFLTLQHISPPSDLTFRVFFSVTFHVHSRSQWLEESGKTHAQKEEEEINLKRKQPYIWWTRFNVELICRLEWPVISMRHQPSYPIYVLCLPIFFLFWSEGVCIFFCWRDW